MPEAKFTQGIAFQELSAFVSAELKVRFYCKCCVLMDVGNLGNFTSYYFRLASRIYSAIFGENRALFGTNTKAG